MKTLYIHAYSGIAGDMLLGAMVDLGVDVNQLQQELHKLDLDGYEVYAEKVSKNGICGTKVHVKIDESHHHRGFSTIKQIINNATLSSWVKDKSIGIFSCLAEAEAFVHGTSMDAVHFHEVGAIDAIIDIVGNCIALELLGKPEIVVSPLQVGTGFVRAAHGIIPVPAPATLKIFTQCEVTTYSRGLEAELVTPTGAALVASLADGFGAQPAMTLQAIGYGAGSRDYEIPNFTRLLLGERKKNNFQSFNKQHAHSHGPSNHDRHSHGHRDEH